MGPPCPSGAMHAAAMRVCVLKNDINVSISDTCSTELSSAINNEY